jgi:hypothetical protein
MRYYAVHAVRFSNNSTPHLYRCPPDCLGFKLTRELGKGFLRNLNIRIHRDITGEIWFGVGVNLISV